jgi:Pyridoxamine 5'-phosphate oxidase
MSASATPTSTHALLRDGGEASEWLRDPGEAYEWSSVIKHLERSSATYWLATVDPDRNPQVRPIMAVWVHGELHFSSGPATRKAKNLALDPHCAVAVEHGLFDLVVHGIVEKVRDASTLQDIANAYAEINDWHVTVRDGAFHDVGGAPTAGPPPYEVYKVVPTTAFVFPLDESVSPTRWVFRGEDDQ